MSTARHLDADSLDIDVGERIEETICIGLAEVDDGRESLEALFVRIEVGTQNLIRVRITVHENKNSDPVITH